MLDSISVMISLTGSETYPKTGPGICLQTRVSLGVNEQKVVGILGRLQLSTEDGVSIYSGLNASVYGSVVTIIPNQATDVKRQRGYIFAIPGRFSKRVFLMLSNLLRKNGPMEPFFRTWNIPSWKEVKAKGDLRWNMTLPYRRN
jgi:hypothetical protein